MKKLILAVIAAATLASPVMAQSTSAVAELQPTSASKAHGTVWFVPKGNKLQIVARIEGLAPGSVHGFHIHQYGDETSADGSSAGDHFNPGKDQHAGPGATHHHAGDLGNVKANAGGVAELDITVDELTANQILGRAVVLHANADDLKSQPSGNAGGRIAVGTIGIANPKTIQAMNPSQVRLGSPPSSERIDVPYTELETDSPRVDDLHRDHNLQNQPIDGTLDRKVGPNNDIRDIPRIDLEK